MDLSFPEELLVLVGSFLDWIDLASCRRVAQTWRRCLAQTEWHGLEQACAETLARRRRARLLVLVDLQQGSNNHKNKDDYLECLDRTVATLSVRILWKRYSYADRQAMLERLKETLDAGGQWTQQQQQHVRQPLVVEATNRFIALQHDPERSVEEKILAMHLWQELILAGFGAWPQQQHYNVYTISPWLVRWVLSGGCHGKQRNQATTPTFRERWEAWRLLRLIIFTQKQTLSQEAFERFCRDQVSMRIIYDNLGPTGRPLDLWFAKHYLRFMLSQLDMAFVLHSCMSTRMQYLLLAVVDKNDATTKDLLESELDWNLLFCSIWSNKSSQKFFCQCIRRLPWLCRLLIQRESLLSKLCHRKDRQTFEVLFQLEPHAMVSLGIPRALQLLPMVRGRKERLQFYLSSIQRVGRQKKQVLKELHHLVGPFNAY